MQKSCLNSDFYYKKLKRDHHFDIENQYGYYIDQQIKKTKQHILVFFYDL